MRGDSDDEATGDTHRRGVSGSSGFSPGSMDSVLLGIVRRRSKAVRTKIDKLGRDIIKKLKFLQSQSADRLAEEITSTDDSRVMFEAVRSLCKVKEPKPVIIHNDEGNPVGTDTEKANIVKAWYEKKFNGPDPPLCPFVGPPVPLSVPVTPLEGEKAAKKLKNGKASGPDQTPNELLKYAGTPFYNTFSIIKN